MKKIYLWFICFLFLFIPGKIFAYQEGISSFYIDATVIDNGDMQIKELIILNGEFNGFERIINFSNSRLGNFDGSLNSFSGSNIYNGSDIELITIKNIDVEETSGFDTIYNSGDNFKKVDSANSGDYGKYTVTNRYNGDTYRIYNPSKGKVRGFYIEYKVCHL